MTSSAKASRKGIGVRNALLGVAGVFLVVAWLVPLREAPMTVTFTRGTTFIETSSGDRVQATPGTQVSPGDRVLTTDGSARIDVGDGHQITVHDSSEVSIETSKKTLIGSSSSHRVDIEGGRARVGGEGRDGSSLDIGLPSGVAGVRGTSFVAEVAGDATLLSVHQGLIEAAPSQGPSLSLGAGEGAIVTATGAESRALPSQPTILSPGPGTLVDSAGTALAWSAVAEAVLYGIEFGTDESFGEILLTVESDSTSVEVPLLEEDRPVFVRVYAITADGLEGAPSDGRSLQIRLRAALGRSLQEAGDLAASITELQAALPFYESDVRLLKDLGWSLYLAERLEESRDAYESARELEPADLELLVELGRVYFWLEDYEAAETTYDEALDLGPDDADALWGLGDVYRVTDRPDEAISMVRRALQIDPQHPYAAETLRILLEGR